MEEDQRLNFNQFADAFNAYQSPNLAARAPEFMGYGYEAPSMDMMLAPQQMPQMQMNPFAINDPSVAAAMQVLNNPMMIRQMPGLLGDGADYQRQFGLLEDIAPTKLQQYQRIAPPPPPPVSRSGGDNGGGGGESRGGGGGGGGGRGRGRDSNFSVPGDDDYMGYDPGSQPGDDDYMGYDPGGSPGSQPGDDDYMGYDSGGRGGGGGGGGGKIICTAMNQAYGFGSFRNAIWIAYADKHLTKAHEAGYHALFLPLVNFGFKRGNGKVNVAVRKVMEWGTRHRSTDLRAQMRGTKRDTTGRIIRMIFEPLCYAVGKLKGN